MPGWGARTATDGTKSLFKLESGGEAEREGDGRLGTLVQGACTEDRRRRRTVPDRQGKERWRGKTTTKNRRRSPIGLLRYGDENIDPWSFFYTLASRSTGSEGRNRIYSSVAEAFDMTREPSLDHRFIFPTPNPVNTLFHNAGEGDPPLLWTCSGRPCEESERSRPITSNVCSKYAVSQPENSPKLSFSSTPKISCLSTTKWRRLPSTVNEWCVVRMAVSVRSGAGRPSGRGVR